VRVEARDLDSLAASAQPQLRANHKRSECACRAPSAALHWHRANSAVPRVCLARAQRRRSDTKAAQTRHAAGHVLWRTRALARGKTQLTNRPHGRDLAQRQVAEECALGLDSIEHRALFGRALLARCNANATCTPPTREAVVKRCLHRGSLRSLTDD